MIMARQVLMWASAARLIAAGLACVVLLLPVATTGQVLPGCACTPDALGVSSAQIDSIFSDWNGTDRPGGAMIIVHHGQPVCQKAYGLASLEYAAPNTCETIFNVASVSKQFTAFGILLLEQQGKLRLDDDIRRYLPDLPDFGETITIRHMLQHTSGLRSLHALFQFAGWRGDDRRSGDDLMQFMQKQRALNFPVGSEYLYCNTGFIFAAEIIEVVTGQAFNDWMTEHVFAQLGMHSTFFREDYTVVVPDVATSYYGPPGAYRKSVEFWAYHGSGNLHTTVGDLARWMDNFRTQRVGGPAVFDRFLTNAVLTSGDTIDYALGINVNRYRGHTQYVHGGSIGGYRAHLVYFPDHQLGIAVLGNSASAGPAGKAYALADLLLDGEASPEPGPVVTASSHGTRPPTRAEVDRLKGHYKWLGGNPRYRQIVSEDGRLLYVNNDQRTELGVLPSGDLIFLGITNEIELREAVIENKAVLAVYENGVLDGYLRKFKPWDWSDADIAALAGRYYSPEVETAYILRQDEKGLIIDHPRHEARRIVPRERDHLQAGGWHIKVHRDQQNKISGISMTNGRVRNLWFARVE